MVQEPHSARSIPDAEDVGGVAAFPASDWAEPSLAAFDVDGGWAQQVVEAFWKPVSCGL